MAAIRCPHKQPTNWSIEHLAIASRPQAGTPGVRGASVDFDLTQAGGRARVAIEQGALDLPRVFEEPLVPIDRLTGNAEWKHDGARLSVQVSGLQFANGVALTSEFVAFAQTGSYCIDRILLDSGRQESWIPNLPAFPDNIAAGDDGLVWVTMASARKAATAG